MVGLYNLMYIVLFGRYTTNFTYYNWFFKHLLNIIQGFVGVPCVLVIFSNNTRIVKCFSSQCRCAANVIHALTVNWCHIFINEIVK